VAASWRCLRRCPRRGVELFELFRAGRLQEADALQARLLPVAKFFGTTHGIAGLKAALNAAGYDIGDPRPPLLRLDAAGLQMVTDVLSLFHEAHGHVAS